VTKSPSDAEEEVDGDLALCEKVDLRGTLGFYVEGRVAPRRADGARPHLPLMDPRSPGTRIARRGRSAASQAARTEARQRAATGLGRMVQEIGMVLPGGGMRSDQRSIQSRARIAQLKTPPVDRMAFEASVLPHLDAAYNLARWLLRNEDDAKDVVQDAYLKAFRFYDGFRGGNSRSWLLTIVRNACYTWLRQARPDEVTVPFDEDVHGRDSGGGPEADVLRSANAQSLQDALERLPIGLREAIVLRELEGLSYAEIAAVADIPIGTVMSRLSRSRKRLREFLSACAGQEISS